MDTDSLLGRYRTKQFQSHTENKSGQKNLLTVENCEEFLSFFSEKHPYLLQKM
jgi:hypothetical protein